MIKEMILKMSQQLDLSPLYEQQMLKSVISQLHYEVYSYEITQMIKNGFRSGVVWLCEMLDNYPASVERLQSNELITDIWKEELDIEALNIFANTQSQNYAYREVSDTQPDLLFSVEILTFGIGVEWATDCYIHFTELDSFL